MPTELNINGPNNQININTTENKVVVVDNNLPNNIEVTQPVASVVEVYTGPIGPRGDIPTSGSFNFTGSFSVSGSATISGSLSVTQGITGSLLGTASYAQQALSSSYASTASYVLNAVSSSYSQTASYSFNAVSSSYSLTATSASYSISSSFASTASYVNPLQQNVIITGSLLVTQSHISTVDYIDFNPNIANLAFLTGRLHWTDDTKTLQIDTDVNDFEIELGHQNIVRGRNVTGYTLTKGMIVYINGESGNRPTFTTASWEGDPTSASTLGFVAQNINDNQTGYVITNGILRGLNTNAFAPGTQLYLSSSGQYTSTVPVSPLHEVRLGKTITQATNGYIYIDIMNGYEIGELHDVLIVSKSSGDLLVYNSASRVWKNTKQLTGSYVLTGSLTADSFTGSLQGTASYSNTASYVSNAISSSFSSTASYYGGSVTSASYASSSTSASYSNNSTSASYANTASYVITAQTASYYGGSVTSASYASSSTSASYASTASFITTAQTASYVLNAISASYSTLAQTSNTASYVATASWANTSITASYVTLAQTASYVQTAQTASYVLQAVSSSYATLAQTANTASYIVTAQTASFIATASWATNAITASYISGSNVDGNITGNATNITAYTINQNLGTANQVTFAGITSSLQGTSSWSEKAVTASYIAAAGNNNEIQYNSNGSFAATSSFAFIHASGSLQHGVSVIASGIASHAEGDGTVASGTTSHAEGGNTQASGSFSHAEGSGTAAYGVASHAEGRTTIALDNYSHAEGEGTVASGVFSHAEGSVTQTVGYASHAEGEGTVAIGNYSHTEGSTTKAGWKGFTLASLSSGTASIAEAGDFTSIFVAPNAIITDTGLYNYNSSSFDGSNTSVYLDNIAASFTYLAEINFLNEASAPVFLGGNSHAEGQSTFALGNASHAEGYSTQAIGVSSHAEGYYTQALGDRSHAEGQDTKAIGVSSHAEGRATQALGVGSHAEGLETIASGSYQHVSGQYNTHGNTTSLFIIGNGVDTSTRSDLALFNIDGILFNQPVTASIVSASFIGNLTGTASYATQALSASWAPGSGGGATFVGGTNIAKRIITSTGTTPELNGEANLTFNGSTLTVTGNVTASSFTGSLQGTATTASYVQTAQTASYVLQAVSSSYATTASYVNGIRTKSNQVAGGSFAGNPKKATVTFTTPFANNNYSITITGEDLRSWTVESKVSGSFVINANSNTAFTGNVFWIAVSHGEFLG